ncbi:dihydrofolate reductase family protein [Humibacillus xanthopallidus]|uniref:Riboflavin biosynthesis pyrimidine reductase n=1 Tax=Humibacillus xanthopallidus TaxID=412689 RepID=A0A543HHK6_9MICO|nr:dihydrofolate reductase family protein [Humibacillus xanthopallidus]TQM57804.1 riboflavin biosynthesis pyrimidine reductase [Humibacillus xanthopallidus]
MRLLVSGSPAVAAPADLDALGDAALYAVYAPPRVPWLRANMVCSLDGSATGADGRSGGINTDADHVVFELLRAQSHAVVVGAGTLRDEGYSPISVDDRWRGLRQGDGLPPSLPLVAVSNRGQVPPRLDGVDDGSVLLATAASAPGLEKARSSLGEQHVIVCGDERVDPSQLVEALARRGWTRLLTEGGPSWLSTLVGQGLLDELCLTLAPTLVGGDHPRTLSGPEVAVDLDLHALLEQDGTLLGRWLTRR